MEFFNIITSLILLGFAIFFIIFFLISAKLSRTKPLIMFFLFPIPLTIVSLVLLYFLLLSTVGENLGILGLGVFIVLSLYATIIIPLNLLSWGLTVNKYKKRTSQPGYEISRLEKCSIVVFFVLLTIISPFIVNRVWKDFQLPKRSTLKAAVVSGAKDRNEYILIEEPKDSWKAIYHIRKLNENQSEAINMETNTTFVVPLLKIDAIAYSLDKDHVFLFERNDWDLTGIVIKRRENKFTSLKKLKAFTSEEALLWSPIDNKRTLFMRNSNIIKNISPYQAIYDEDVGTMIDISPETAQELERLSKEPTFISLTDKNYIPAKLVVGSNDAGYHNEPDMQIYSPNKEMFYTFSRVRKFWLHVRVSLFDKNFTKIGDYYISGEPYRIFNIGWSPSGDYILIQDDNRVLQIYNK